jgi:hypothetical protein
MICKEIKINMLRLCVILNFSGLLWLENKKLPANDRELLFFCQYYLIYRLFSILDGENGNVGFVVFPAAEFNDTIYEGKQGVVLAHAYIQAGVVNRATLTDNDVTGLCSLSTINLNAEAFAV